MSEPRTPADEVSLRDLYLVLRRSVWGIVATVAVVALVVYAVAATRPSSYGAEATTAIARAPVTVQQEFGLSFRPEIDVTFDTYQTLAFSRAVLERVQAAWPDSGGAREGFTLERLAGAANAPSSLLAVAHRVRHRDPEAAAALATAWAHATIDTVRALLNENLDTAERITGEGLARARATLGQADAQVRAVREAQDGLADPQRLIDAHARLAALDVRADEVGRLVRAREAEAGSLRARLTETPDEVVVLTDAPEVPLTLVGAMWALEARLAALRAELEVVEAQRAAVRSEIRDVTVALARFDDELLRRVRAQEAAQRAYDSLLAIEPTIAYVAQIAPTGARVLSEAARPQRPEPQRSLLTATLAAVAAAFLAVVVVLLREAVRDPAVASPTVGSGAPPERAVEQPG